MRIDELPNSVRAYMHRLSGALNLPDLYSFESVEHWLVEVNNRVAGAKSLLREAGKNLGG